MTHIQRHDKDGLARTSRKKAAQKELIKAIDHLLATADKTLSPTPLNDVPVPDCPLARQVAASARESLTAQTQALP